MNQSSIQNIEKNTLEAIMKDLNDALIAGDHNEDPNSKEREEHTLKDQSRAIVSLKKTQLGFDLKLNNKAKIIEELINKRREDSHEIEHLSQEKVCLLSKVTAMNDIIVEFESSIPSYKKELASQSSVILGKRADFAASENIRANQADRIAELEKEVDMYKRLYEASNQTIKKYLSQQRALHSQSSSGTNFDFPEYADFFNFEEACQSEGEVGISLAERVLKNDLEELKSHLEKEEQLMNKVEQLEKELLDKEQTHDSTLSSLKEQYESLRGSLESIQNVDPNLSIRDLSDDQFKNLLLKMKELRERNTTLSQKMKEYAKGWAKNLQESAEKDFEVIKLKKSYQDIQSSFAELEEITEKRFNQELKEKIVTRDRIIKQQGSQLQNLLYENHKLRGYLQSKLGEFVWPLHPLPGQEKLSPVKSEDKQFYISLEGLVDQNKKLREKLYLIENKGASGRRMTKSEYSTLLEKFENSKEKIKELKQEIKSWKDNLKNTITQKSELQTKLKELKREQRETKESMELRINSLENVKSQLLAEVTSLSQKNTEIEIDSLLSKQELENLKKTNLLLEEKKSELQNELKKKLINDKSKIWEKIEIIVEDHPQDSNLYEINNQITRLHEVIHDNIIELRSFKEKSKENHQWELKVLQLTEHISLLESLLGKEKRMNLVQQQEILREIACFKESESSDSQKLHTIGITSNIAEVSPSLFCIRLSNEYNDLKKKYNELRSENDSKIDNNTNIDKNHQLRLETKLHALEKQLENEMREKENILSMLEGENKGVFDAIKFEKIVKDNQDLAKEIDSLRLALAEEKSLSQAATLKVEDLMRKIHLLNEEYNNQNEIKSTLILQVEHQREVHLIEKKQSDTENLFLKTESDMLKIKMEKMIEGIKLLKSYMYGSLSPDQISDNQVKLSLIDSHIDNIGRSIIGLKKEYSIKSSELQKEASKKLQHVLQGLERNADSIMGLASKEEKAYIEEIENLKTELSKLRLQKDADEAELKQRLRDETENMSIINEQKNIRIEDGLGNNINMDRLTNALQKGIDMLVLLKQGGSSIQ